MRSPTAPRKRRSPSPDMLRRRRCRMTVSVRRRTVHDGHSRQRGSPGTLPATARSTPPPPRYRPERFRTTTRSARFRNLELPRNRNDPNGRLHGGPDARTGAPAIPIIPPPGPHARTSRRTGLRVRKTKSPRSLGDFFRAAALRPQASDYFTMFEMRNVAATVRIA